MRRESLMVFLLAPATMASALAVVLSTYEARQLTSGYQQSRVEHEQLVFEQEQLRLDRSAWTAKPRIDSVAKRQLSMVPLSRAVDVIVLKAGQLLAPLGDAD